MSQTFTLTGTGSQLNVVYNPPIELEPNSFYKLGLLGIFTSNSIPNIDETTNKFHYGLNREIKLDKGVFTVQQIDDILKKHLGDTNISLKYSSVTKKVELQSRFDIDFTPLNSIYKLLGFVQKNYRTGTIHSSALPLVKDIVVVTEKNNHFYCSITNKELTIDTGTYNIIDIENYLKKHLGDSNISLKINLNTQKCELQSVYDIDFTRANTFNHLLGFSPKLYSTNKLHTSDLPVQIFKVYTIRVNCNITKGSYHNSEQSHTIYEFGINSPPGYIINETPRNIIYYPLNTRTISNISLDIVDQDDNLINLRGEPIIVRLEIKQWY